jgi:hypothetical protein
MKGANLMKFNRQALLRAAGAAVGATALAGGLAFAAAPAHADVTTNFKWCDFISNTSVGIDAWSGNNWFGLANHNNCQTNTAVGAGEIDFFLNNQATAVKVGSINVNGTSLTATFTGTIGHVHESISNGT